MEYFEMERARAKADKELRISGELLRANEKRWDDQKRADGIHAGIIKPDDESSFNDTISDSEEAELSGVTADDAEAV